MNYLSYRIKSMKAIEPSPDLHRKIMRRIFLERLKRPYFIIVSLSLLSVIVDGWHLFSESATLSHPFSVLNYSPIGLMTANFSHTLIFLAAILNLSLLGYLAFLFVSFEKQSKEKAAHPQYAFLEHLYHHLLKTPFHVLSRLYRWKFN